MLRVGNMPPGLRKLVPAEFKPKKDADAVFIDRKAIEAAKEALGKADQELLLLEAYSRVLGCELVTLTSEEIPEAFAAAAKTLITEGDVLTGAAVIKTLETPGKLDDEMRVALPALAEALHAKMGAEELAKGVLKNEIPEKRWSEADLSRWFAASVSEIRETAGDNPIDLDGAKRLVQLTKTVILNYGGNLVTRGFFDEAVRDLATQPGLSDDGTALLTKFRMLTQPGRNSHIRTEKGVLVSLDRARRKQQELGLLNETQKKAIAVSTEAQKDKVAAARTAVLEKIKTWGFTEEDLDKAILYVEKHARITVQFHPDKKLPDGTTCIDSFLADPKYKNQFETKISSGSLGPKAGSSRDGWEKKLFRGAYHEATEFVPEERPKYGGLSPLNNPRGNGGDWYGSCFLELRQDVKFRSTFTPSDSAGCQADQVTTLDTVEVMFEQVMKSDPEYLKSLFEVARGDKYAMTKKYNRSYIEAQVHGELRLDRDVDFIVIHTKYMTTPYGEKLKQLAEAVGASIKYTDQTKFRIAEP